MKKLLVALLFAMILTGCSETVKDDGRELDGITLGENQASVVKTHTLDDVVIETTYSIPDAKAWYITQNKDVRITMRVLENPSNKDIRMAYMHADVSLASKYTDYHGMKQDNMNHEYKGVSQDGYELSLEHPFENIFSIDAYSDTFLRGWSYSGTGSAYETRPTERKLRSEGVYGNEFNFVFNILIKEEGDSLFHIETFKDDFEIFTTKQ